MIEDELIKAKEYFEKLYTDCPILAPSNFKGHVTIYKIMEVLLISHGITNLIILTQKEARMTSMFASLCPITVTFRFHWLMFGLFCMGLNKDAIKSKCGFHEDLDKMTYPNSIAKFHKEQRDKTVNDLLAKLDCFLDKGEQ